MCSVGAEVQADVITAASPADSCVTAVNQLTDVTDNCVSSEADDRPLVQSLHDRQNCSPGVDFQCLRCATSPLKRRLAVDDTCAIPHKRAAVATTHSPILGTSTVGMISAAASCTSALPSFPAATLPSFPPVLFSCFPSLASSRPPSGPSAVPPRGLLSPSRGVLSPPWGVLSPPRGVVLSARDSTCLSRGNMLFSIPVHGMTSVSRPFILVPSIQDCVLIPSLCSTPLLYVISAPSTNAAAPTMARAQLPQRPMAAAVSFNQSAASVSTGNPVPSTLLPSIPALSLVQQQHVGRASMFDQSAASAAGGSGNPQIPGTLQSMMVPNIPGNSQITGSFSNISVLSPPFRPVGGATAADQSCASVAGIPQLTRNSLPLGLSLPNVSLLSHILPQVGGRASVSVDQSAVRLHGSLRIGPSVVMTQPQTLNNARNRQIPGSLQPLAMPAVVVSQLNGVIRARSDAVLVPGLLRPSSATAYSSLTSTKLLSIPSVMLPRCSLGTGLSTPTLTSSLFMSTRPLSSCPRSSAAGPLDPVVCNVSIGPRCSAAGTQCPSILRTVLSEQMKVMLSAASVTLPAGCAPVAQIALSNSSTSSSSAAAAADVLMECSHVDRKLSENS